MVRSRPRSPGPVWARSAESWSLTSARRAAPGPVGSCRPLAGFSQLIPPEVNPLDVRIGYTVTSTVPLTDIHLSGNPAISPIGATGAVVVTESVTPAGGATLAPIQIYAINNISGQPVTQAADSLVFANGASYTSLNITKDILLTSGTGIPSISFINQTFSVPEPGSVVLMGLGCLGMVGYGLKRRQSMGG